MTWGVDYPWTHPDPAAIAAAGAGFAMRYLSTDPTKNLTAGEADALAAVGVWSGVVWETTAGRARAGQDAGVADAKAAAGQAAACGMPASRPIYFAVDTDASWSSVEPYFAGVASVLGAARTGVYGGLAVIQGAAASGLVSWLWQTSAWSGGQWDPRAHLRQTDSVTVGGVECDRNDAMTSDFGQWMPGRTPSTSQPAQGSPAIPQGDDVAFMDGMVPTGFAFDAAAGPGDGPKDPKAVTVIPLPFTGDSRWPYTMVDLSFSTDFAPKDHPVKLRVAVRNRASGWRVDYLAFHSEAGRVHVWLQQGDDQASVGRVPLTADDTASDAPVTWFVEAK